MEEVKIYLKVNAGLGKKSLVGAAGACEIHYPDGGVVYVSRYRTFHTFSVASYVTLRLALQMLKSPSKVIVYTNATPLINGRNKGWFRRWKENGMMRGCTKYRESLENAQHLRKLFRVMAVHKIDFVFIKSDFRDVILDRLHVQAYEAVKERRSLYEVTDNYAQWCRDCNDWETLEYSFEPEIEKEPQQFKEIQALFAEKIAIIL